MQKHAETIVYTQSRNAENIYNDYEYVMYA